MPHTEPDPTTAIGREALDALRLMLMDDDVTDASRVAAAKTLLDRFMPKDDIELKRREADERAAALANARCLLAEFALAKSAGLHGTAELVEISADEPDNA